MSTQKFLVLPFVGKNPIHEGELTMTEAAALLRTNGNLAKQRVATVGWDSGVRTVLSVQKASKWMAEE